MYKITLTIPTFNRAGELSALLGSVARQTLDPALWECILIDNHSTDHTAEVVEAFCQAHPQLHIRRVVEPMAGVSYARNRGLQEATTDLVCSVDDDERINPRFLAAYLDFFTSHPEAVVAGGKIIAEYPDGRPRWMSRWTERPIANPIDLGEKIRPFPRGMLPGGGNMGYRLSVARQFGFLTELGRTGDKPLGGEENDFFLRLQEAGHTLWYLPEAVIRHIIPQEKLTDERFRALAYHIGISQAIRARMRGEYLGLRLREGLKWVATLLLGLTMHPRKWQKVVVMRREISRGIAQKGVKQSPKGSK